MGNNNGVPVLPSEISNDGREVWDWASALSKLAQENHELRTLRKCIAESKSRCGSCYFWMKSSLCPREVHSNKTGRSSGPNMNSPICQKFKMETNAAERINNMEARIAEILAARSQG